MNRFITILILTICQWNLAAQLVISGQILAKEDQDPIPAAEVFLVEENLLQPGTFQFNNLDTGDYQILVLAVGYQSRQIDIHLTQDTSLEVFLEPLATELSEVIIQDQRDALFALTRLRAVEGTAIYAGKKSEVIRLDKVLGNVAANNSRQVYSQIAGLNIYEGSDGGLQLAIGGRGLDPSRTSNFNTRQNGYDISADVLGYPESYYTPPAQALSEIQIIRGAASLQYGTQFGGLINFKTRQLPLHKNFELRAHQSLGSFGFINSYNSIAFRKNKWSFSTYLNYKSGNGYRSNSKFNAKNVFASVKYDLNSQASFKFEYTKFLYLAKQAGGLTDAQFIQDPRQSTRDRNWFQVNWNLFHALYTHKFSSKRQLTINAFGLSSSRFSVGFRGNPIFLNENPITAIDEVDSEGNYLLPRDVIKGFFRNAGMEARYLSRYKISGKRSIWLVGSKLYYANNQSIQGSGSTRADADFTIRTEQFPDYANQSTFQFPNQNLALFSENIFYLSDQLSLTPGVRVEFINTRARGDYTNVIYDNAGNAISTSVLTDDRSFSRSFGLAGIGISYKPSDRLNTFFNISQNYRSVTFSDIRTVNPSFIIDPDIRDERGFTADAGARGIWNNRLSYDVGIFSIFYRDRIGIILDQRANRVRKNIGNAFIYGLESLIDLQLLDPEGALRINWFSNFSITDSRYTFSEENNVSGKKVEFIPLLNLKSGLTLRYKNFQTSIQYSFLSSQFTDAQNTSTPSIGDSRAGIVGPIPSYQILDLSFSLKKGCFTFETGINNLLDAAYFTRRATGYPGPGIIPSDGRSFYLTIGIEI